MSAEVLPTSEKARKKDKKRKREQEKQDIAPPTPPADIDTSIVEKKKKKKRKHDQIEPQEGTASINAQPIETQPSKKHKKDKGKSKATSVKASTSTGNRAENTSDLLEKHSPFVQQTTSLYLPLSPCASNFPLEGLCAEHISPLLLTYYPPLHGIILSYSNVRLSTSPPEKTNSKDSANEEEEILARCIDEYAVMFVWLTADFLLFRPRKGTWMEGYVSVENESLLGLVCYNYFNAVIERDKLPQDWEWVDEAAGNDEHAGQMNNRGRWPAEGNGHFVKGDGEKVQGKLVFRVEDFEATVGDGGGGSVSILGTLLPQEGKR